MTKPVSSIKNLGPSSEESFARAGITTAEQVYALGADATYTMLLKAGSKPHFIMYYALVMGLQGRLWNTCTPDEKKELRKRFDKLKSNAKPKDKGRTQLDAALDQIGVVEG